MDAIIFKMNLSDKYSDSISLFNELQRFLFEEEKNEGYSDLVLETKTYISGSVINKIPTFLYVFDTDKQLIEKREEIIVKKVDFSIDINNMLFEIFTSSVKDAKRVYLTINHTLKDELKLHPYDTTISEILISINNNIENVDFTKLHIKNFKLENLAQGYFEIKNIQNEYAWSLIEEYKKDITKVSLDIVYEDFNHSLSISESGKVKITSRNKGKTKTFFDVLKEKVFKLK